MMKVTFGEMYHKGHTLEEYGISLQQKAVRFNHEVPNLKEVSQAKPLKARICHSMLIVDCPDCNGAEIVWKDTLLMMCAGCFNSRAHGKWRKVEIPKNLDLIIAALERRPVHVNRNWFPNETLEDLIRENEEHKDEIF